MNETILGINRRNVDFVARLNPREHFDLVDNKFTTKRLLSDHGFPTPPLLASARTFFQIPDLLAELNELNTFVIKPARGSRGGGIVVVTGHRGTEWVLADNRRWSQSRCYDHIADILYGVYSLDNSTDIAIAEHRVVAHPALRTFAHGGMPDIRVIVHRGVSICAMMRSPTARSQGKANLHAGGFAVAIDLASGRTGRGWYRRKHIAFHPDTGEPLAGIQIPGWKRIVELCNALRSVFPLDYIGVDLVVDAEAGPQVLELNARPGLEIQNVCDIGLRGLLEEPR